MTYELYLITVQITIGNPEKINGVTPLIYAVLSFPMLNLDTASSFS